MWKMGGTGELVASLPGHARQVTAILDMASDDTTLWTAGLDHCIRIWDRATHKLKYCIGPTTGGHSDAVTGLLRYRAGTDTFVLSCSLDRTVKVWNAVSGECVASGEASDGIICMCIAQDAAQQDVLLLGMENGSIQGRSITGGPGVAPLQCIFSLVSHVTGVGHQGPVQCLVAGPKGTFYSGGNDGNMLVMSFRGSLQELLQNKQHH